MGGLNSEIKETTKTVVFEAAKFSYGNIRQSARFLGMSTEASMRFSKGVSATASDFALRRVMNLVEQMNAGTLVSGEIDILSEDISDKKVEASAKRVNTLLGSEISGERMRDILNSLELNSTLSGDVLNVSVPAVRADVTIEADIAEEVARIYGYDNIEAQPLKGAVTRAKMGATERAKERMKRHLVSNGYFECVTYSFGPMSAQSAVLDDVSEAIKLMNPLGEDKSVMRLSMIPDMLAVVATNLNQKATNLRLFETGKTYRAKDINAADLANETETLILAATHTDFLGAESGCGEHPSNAWHFRTLCIG